MLGKLLTFFSILFHSHFSTPNLRILTTLVVCWLFKYVGKKKKKKKKKKRDKKKKTIQQTQDTDIISLTAKVTELEGQSKGINQRAASNALEEIVLTDEAMRLESEADSLEKALKA